MKNKKLFAILTLVCFMFTLMPVAAFAATPEAGDGYVTVNTKYTTSVKAGVEFDLAVVEGTTDSYVYFAIDEDGDVEGIYTTAKGTIKTPGVYEVYAVEKSAADAIDSAPGAALLTKSEKVELYMDNATFVKEFADLTVKAVDVEYTVAVQNPYGYPGTTFTAATTTENAKLNITADGGYTDIVLAAKVTTGDKAVKGADVDFATNGYGLKVVEVDSVTDKKGVAEFKVSATVAGSYKIYVTYEDGKAVIDVTVASTSAAKVEVVAEPTAPVDVKTAASATGIGFKLYDVNGNVINGKDATSVYNDLKVNVAAQPADSSFKTEFNTAPKLKWDTTNNYWTLNDTALVEEGNYSFLVTLPNGTTAMASVKVQEFDEAVAMKLVYNPATVGLGDTANIAKLLLIDANGVQKNIAGAANIAKYGVELAANGAAVATFDETNGALKVTSDKDYLGSVVTVYAVCDELIASAEIAVVEEATTLEFTKTTADVAVTNTLVANVVNESGKNVALNVTTGSAVAKVIVLDKPENALAAGSATVNAQNNKVNVSFTASEAGEYKIQVVVTYTEGTVTRYLSAIETITVGGTAGQFEDVVVMSIGANKVVVNSDVKAIPAAPMIKDQRTFVPFRALAEAFGANVEWVEATQSVVAELNGVKVVMVIGEEAYTVNGVAKTADVAPFINGASTMVPVRFVAEAFGITVTPIYAEDGTVADVLFAK